jgi:rare lipoprotein A (peptidoglycan hydrolase)
MVGAAADAVARVRGDAATLGCLLLLLMAGCAAQAHPPVGGLHVNGRQPPATTAPAPSANELAALPQSDLPSPPPPKPSFSNSFTGRASWYGKDFHGRLTASGEPYDMAALTAAHQTLPFGSRVRVTNLANGRSVVVTINDRGPFAEDRLIDLSHAAAKRLDIVEDGVAEVRIDVLAEGGDVAG